MSLPKNSKDIAGLRAFLTAVKDQNCSLMEKYSEPIRKLAESLNQQLTTVLAALPTEKLDCEWASDDVLNALFMSLNNANAITVQLSLELSKLTNGNTMAAEALTAAIEQQVAAGELFRKTAFETAVAAEVAKRQSAGELVPKAMVDTLCAESLTKGIAEGRTQLQAELDAKAQTEALVKTRKDGITQAGLPLPPAGVEALFADTEENFQAAQKRFTDREAALKKDGITLASEDLRNKLWLGDAEYALFESTVRSIPALRGATEPLAGGPAAPEKPSRILA